MATEQTRIKYTPVGTRYIKLSREEVQSLGEAALPEFNQRLADLATKCGFYVNDYDGVLGTNLFLQGK